MNNSVLNRFVPRETFQRSKTETLSFVSRETLHLYGELFPDAESAENFSEQLIGSKFTKNLPHGNPRKTQLLSHHVEEKLILGKILSDFFQRLFCFLKRLNMTTPGNKNTLDRIPETHCVKNHRFQLLNAFSCFR